MTKPFSMAALFGSQAARTGSPTYCLTLEDRRARNAALMEAIEQELETVEEQLTRERIERDEALHEGDDDGEG